MQTVQSMCTIWTKGLTLIEGIEQKIFAQAAMDVFQSGPTGRRPRKNPGHAREAVSKLAWERQLRDKVWAFLLSC